MRDLSNDEVADVYGGGLPDEDLQDMRRDNRAADNWKDVVEQAPSEREDYTPEIRFESAFRF
jgi:hypothetical protein